MKSNFLTWLMPLLAFLFGGAGWLAKDLQLNGVSGAMEPVSLGGFTVTGIGLLLFSIFRNWQSGGGKFDGKLSQKEFESIVKTLTDKFAPAMSQFVDEAGAVVVPLVNKVVEPKLPVIPPKATGLIDALSQWFSDKTPDPNEPVLNSKLLDILSDAVKDHPDGSKAAETLRAALHDVMFKKPPETVPVS